MAAVHSDPANAQFSISSPKVEKAELEVETNSSVQSGFPRADDEDVEKNIRFGSDAQIGYGFTDVWKAEFQFSFQKPEGGGLQASAIEVQNTFQLGSIPRWNATVGLLASVLLGIGSADEPGAFEFGPLIQFGDEKTGSLILNGIFEKTFGDKREKGVGFEYAAQVKVPVKDNVALGIEAFGDIGDIGNGPSFNESELRLGPMLYLSFGDKDDDEEVPHKGKGKGKRDDEEEDKGLRAGAKEPEIEIDAGILFGATGATPDVTFKLDLEVSF